MFVTEGVVAFVAQHDTTQLSSPSMHLLPMSLLHLLHISGQGPYILHQTNWLIACMPISCRKCWVHGKWKIVTLPQSAQSRSLQWLHYQVRVFLSSWPKTHIILCSHGILALHVLHDPLALRTMWLFAEWELVEIITCLTECVTTLLTVSHSNTREATNVVAKEVACCSLIKKKLVVPRKIRQEVIFHPWRHQGLILPQWHDLTRRNRAFD